MMLSASSRDLFWLKSLASSLILLLKLPTVSREIESTLEELLNLLMSFGQIWATLSKREIELESSLIPSLS